MVYYVRLNDYSNWQEMPLDELQEYMDEQTNTDWVIDGIVGSVIYITGIEKE